MTSKMKLPIGGEPQELPKPVKEPGLGAVIRVDGSLRNTYGSGVWRRYQYVFFRASNGRWYHTGSTCPPAGMSWSEVTNMLYGMKSVLWWRVA